MWKWKDIDEVVCSCWKKFMRMTVEVRNFLEEVWVSKDIDLSMQISSLESLLNSKAELPNCQYEGFFYLLQSTFTAWPFSLRNFPVFFCFYLSF